MTFVERTQSQFPACYYEWICLLLWFIILYVWWGGDVAFIWKTWGLHSSEDSGHGLAGCDTMYQRWKQHGPLKHRFPATMLHDVTTQKTVTSIQLFSLWWYVALDIKLWYCFCAVNCVLWMSHVSRISLPNGCEGIACFVFGRWSS
jgi:hypothetical protein